MNDVVVIGNVGIDTNVYLPGQEIDFTVEANFTENVDCIGQAGGYASRTYANLGYTTAFIGAVGEDAAGRWIRETFAREQINLEGIFIDPAGTSRSINFMYPDGRRKNFYDGKSHMTLQPPLAECQRILQGARLAHFNIPNWARQLLPLARQSHVPVAVDLQDVIDLNDPYRQDFIEQADFIFFSAANQTDPAAVVAALLQRRPQAVVISGMGEKGAMLGTSVQGIQTFPPFSLAEPVIDTNGAGDSLAAGFLSAYVLDGLPLAEAILRGQVAARHCCTQRGSSDHLINRELLGCYLNG
jgi:sugar/nucleoside kinase (ribokinase family)